MAKNKAEELVEKINNSIFFKEFTFSNTEIKINGNPAVEIADNIVWIDDIVLFYQIKWKNNTTAHEGLTNSKNWFNNKVIGKGKRQIKETIKYIKDYPDLVIQNDKGFSANLSDINTALAKSIIIYYPDENFPEELRFRKFYRSSEVGLINLFHIEDYLWICRYFVTPAEIYDYLRFRGQLFDGFGQSVDKIPEQLVFSYYISGEEITEISFHQIKYLEKYNEDVGSFDLSNIIRNFFDKIITQKDSSYLMILKELAKLNRFELKEVKSRLTLSIERIKSESYSLPYRVAFPRTSSGFVFIPLNSTDSKYWQNALHNFTLAHKYDQKLQKCIGVVLNMGNSILHFLSPRVSCKGLAGLLQSEGNVLS